MSDMENFTPEEMQKALFSHLVMSLASSAMQHLGKLVNPMTNTTETNIEAAQSTIDVIEMLEAKTKGNLDDEEARFLSQTLTALRMNYVETTTAPAPAPAPEPPKPGTPPADPPPEDKKRFTKKYDGPPRPFQSLELCAAEFSNHW